MPDSVAIAAFVFGAILILIAIIGGEFKLFGSEISKSITNRGLRFFCFFFGAALLVFALGIELPPLSALAPTPNDETPTPEITIVPDQTSTSESISTLEITPETPPSNLSDCVVTVTHDFANFSDRPSHDARVLGGVEKGEYRVLDYRLASWAGREEMWYQIQHNGKPGWIEDSPIIIGSKTASCP